MLTIPAGLAPYWEWPASRTVFPATIRRLLLAFWGVLTLFKWNKWILFRLRNLLDGGMSISDDECASFVCEKRMKVPNFFHKEDPAIY
jgi:hypothetical protein